MQLPHELQQKIVEFLTSLPGAVDSSSLRAFILSAGLDSQLQKRIEFSGSVSEFFQLLVPMLVDYGRLEDKRDALEAVLETAKGHVGLDRQEDCGTLIENLRAVRQTRQHREEKEKQAQKTETDSGGLRKFFISYAHDDTDEEQLARFLESQLTQNNHEVFIDLGIKAGMDWVQEISERINWCECFVVLLSENSMQSEMVLEEIRMAHRAQKNTGTPRIIPIRLRYFGPLDYELEICLGHLQFIKWERSQDFQRVFNEILHALEHEPLPEHEKQNGYERWESEEQNKRPLTVSSRPQAAIDPRTAYVPGGTLRPEDPYYIERPSDNAITTLAQRAGETIMIKAPRQMGKSSLLLRYLVQCQQAGKQVVFIDFSIFAKEDFATYTALLARIIAIILHKLRIRIELPHSISQADATWFIEDHILTALNTPLVFAFDETDRVLGREYQADFFTMLRMWHNNRADPTLPWEQVDLALVISTEPYLLIKESDRSPFNVSYPVELQPFTLEHYHTLNQKYDGVLTDSQIEELWELLQGQPYLTRLAFYRLVTYKPMNFDTLMKCAAEERGPFSDHLRALLVKLHQRPELLKALQQVIRTGTIPHADDYYRLYGAGLVKKENVRINPANLLYARYFRKTIENYKNEE